MQGDFAVLTPERTVVTYRLAGMGARIMAHIIDLLVIFAVIIALGQVAGYAGVLFPQLSIAVLIFVFSALPFLYFILLEGWWNGQSVGKRVMGLRVRMADGTPISMEAAILRNFIRPGDMLPGPYFVGLVSIFFTEQAQRLGDVAANTIVVSERREVTKYAVAPHGVGLHPLEDLIGNLRGLRQHEYHALRRLADRFYEFDLPVQMRLIREVYLPIAKRLSIPPPPPGETDIRMVEAVVMAYGRRKGLL